MNIILSRFWSWLKNVNAKACQSYGNSLIFAQQQIIQDTVKLYILK